MPFLHRCHYAKQHAKSQFHHYGISCYNSHPPQLPKMKQDQKEHRQQPLQPIDIDYAKFLDWLIDRRRIPRNWHTLLKSARTLSRTAQSQTPSSLQIELNLPPSELHTNLHYHVVRETLTILTSSSPPKEAPAADKDLLSRYKSPLLRAWADAAAAFERSHIYLADAAQLLTHNANIEAPAIKADIALLNSDIADAGRREGPAIHAASEARNRFNDACHDFDLDPKTADFQQQLRATVERRVPCVLALAVEKAKQPQFNDAIEYYQQFAAFVAGRQDGAILCPTARRVMKGDIAALTAPGMAKEELRPDFEELDWTEVSMIRAKSESSGSVDNVEIDWGIEVDTSGADASVSNDDMNDGSAGLEEHEKLGIDWGDGEMKVEPIDWNKSTQPQSVQEETSCASCFTLADANTRERYLNDLLELETFLSQRDAEMRRTGESQVGIVVQQAVTSCESAPRADRDNVAQMWEGVKAAIREVNSEETRRLLALQAQPRRLERAARDVLEKKMVAERLEAAIDVLRKRRARSIDELAVLGPRLKELGVITRMVITETEKALEQLYQGRKVHILGEINNIFPAV